MPRPGPRRGAAAPAARARLVARDVVERPVVHERRHQERVGRRARREVGDRGGGDVAAPAVLDREPQAELPRRGRASAARVVSPPTRPILRLTPSIAPAARSSASTSVMTSSRIIGSVVALAHDQALLERRARLLEEHAVEPLERSRGDRPRPAAASRRWRRRSRARRPRSRASTARTRAASSRGSAPSLSWKRRMPSALALAHVGDHLVDRAERDRHVEREVLARAAAEQRRDGHAQRPAEQVPAGDVDRRLRVVVAGAARRPSPP